MLAGAKAQLAEAVVALGRLTGKVDTVLTAFEPVGDGMAPDTSDLAWSDYHTDAQLIVERVAADLNL